MSHQQAVMYCWQHTDHPLDENDIAGLNSQRRQAHEYAQERGLSFVAEYVEPRDKRQKKFPELEKALLACREHNACLLIARLENLTRFDAFIEALLHTDIDFICIDQPTVTHDTLPAVVEYVRQLRMLHSARIRRGLEETVARLGTKLGSPKCMKEIVKVNKPKSESAIMFALILAPIIATYRRKGFSQRKMVDSLNHEGFTAPEGGHWVLSQLQKVLERIELNNVALNSAEPLREFSTQNHTDEQIIQGLTAIPIRAPGGGVWDSTKLVQVRERIELIKEIGDFNRFIVEVYPQMVELEQLGRSAQDVANAFNQKGIKVPDRVLWELSQEEDDDDGTQHVEQQEWNAHAVEVMEHIIDRRRKDMDTFLNTTTIVAAHQVLEKAGNISHE